MGKKQDLIDYLKKMGIPHKTWWTIDKLEEIRRTSICQHCGKAPDRIFQVAFDPPFEDDCCGWDSGEGEQVHYCDLNYMCGQCALSSVGGWIQIADIKHLSSGS